MERIPVAGPSITQKEIVPGIMQRFLIVLLICGLFCFSLPNSVMAAAGDLDSTFGSSGKVKTGFLGLGGRAYAVTMLTNRKVIVGGMAVTLNEHHLFHSDFALARYNTDGTLDTSFGTGGKVLTDFFDDKAEIHDLAVQPDGKIVAVGLARSGASLFFGLVRYNSDGSLDSTFGAGGKVTTSIIGGSEANAVVIQPDGKIVAAGRSDTSESSIDVGFALARYNPNGSLDTTFGSGGKVVTNMGVFGYIKDLVQQPDGRLIAGGFRNDATTQGNYELARYNQDGSLDATFGSNGKVETDFFHGDDIANSVALKSDGKILVVGTANVPPSSFDQDNKGLFGMACYNSDGSLDSTFGDAGKVATDFSQYYSVTFAEDYASAFQPDGKILCVGWAGGNFALARYNSDGSLDDTFGNQGTVLTSGEDGPLFAAILQPDGKLFVAGGWGDEGFSLARYLTAPTDAPILQTEANSNEAVALDSVTFVRGAFSVVNEHNFSSDHRTRIILFATNLTLSNGEDPSSVTAQAETSTGVIHELPVEYVGVVPGCEWFTQVVVKLPDELANAGTVQVSISNSNTSNNGSIFIK